MQLSFGRSVNCKDGSFGKLDDVVVDPATMRLTHLITSPPDAEPRLIPIELADTAGGGPDVALRCTLAATEELASVREYRDLQSTEETGRRQGLGPRGRACACPALRRRRRARDRRVRRRRGIDERQLRPRAEGLGRAQACKRDRHGRRRLPGRGPGVPPRRRGPDHGRRPRREPLLEPLRDHDPGRRRAGCSRPTRSPCASRRPRSPSCPRRASAGGSEPMTRRIRRSPLPDDALRPRSLQPV